MQALRAGAVEFLAKPFDDEVLLVERFERLWRIEPDKERVRARRFSVGAIQRFASGDQPPYERRFEQVIGNSPALESVARTSRTGCAYGVRPFLSREKQALARS